MRIQWKVIATSYYEPNGSGCGSVHGSIPTALEKLGRTMSRPLHIVDRSIEEMNLRIASSTSESERSELTRILKKLLAERDEIIEFAGDE